MKNKTKKEAAVTPVPTVTPTEPQAEGQKMLTLKKTKTNKAGEVYYSFGAGSIRFSKSVFVAGQEAPAELSLEVPEGVFAPAGAIRATGGGSRVASPEKLAKLQAIAEKQEARSKK